ncbi:trypsin-like serine protease [Streptomyces globosus]|uniref:trypsin-like serine protease n=1 Tax=Streptomyces globosus TaxID=68209 RepID=UPI0037FDA4A9
MKPDIGDEANSRACTGTRADPRWVLTAASCFAATPGKPVPAGTPALKSTAVLSNGQTRDTVEVSASASDRDVLLARLATPAPESPRPSSPAGLRRRVPP